MVGFYYGSIVFERILFFFEYDGFFQGCTSCWLLAFGILKEVWLQDFRPALCYFCGRMQDSNQNQC